MEDNLNNGEILIPSIEESDFSMGDIAQNKITAIFKLIAVGTIEVITEITSRVPDVASKDTEIYSRAIGISSSETILDVKHRGNSNILTEIQPIGHINLETEIEVRPHNKMWANYEVQRPPIVTSIIKPSQDSFTREKSEFQSINYGSSSSMVVGRYGDDIWRSFVQFELSELNPSYILTESNLRLYYKGSAPKGLKLEILNADKVWYEYSITNLNKPNPINLISNTFTINETRGYIEFDVMNIVKSWLEKYQDNNGFIIRVSNESEVGQATFYTRETSFAPELVIRYYDSTVFSQGRTQVVTEINVMKFGKNDILTEVEAHSTYSLEYLDTEIYVHRVEEPLDSDVLTEITATCVANEVSLIVSIHADEDIPTETTVRVPYSEVKDIELAVSRQVVPIEIFSKYGNTIKTEVTVQRYEDYDLPTIISVTKDTIHSEIYVKHRKDVDTSLVVQRNEDYDVLTEVDSSRTNVSTEIYVKHRDDILVELTTKALDNLDIKTEINSSRKVVPIEIFVKYFDAINSEIGIRAYNKNDIATEITSSQPFILTEIRATNFVNEDLQTEIAYSRPKVDTEITVTQASIGVEISSRIGRNKDLYTEINATRPQIQTEVTVRYRSDILTEITPNIKSDVLTEILVINANVTTVITPRIIGDSNTDAEVYVKYEAVISTEITSRAVSQVYTEILVDRVISQIQTEILHSKGNLPTVITVPTWVDCDINTTIEPRIFMVNNVYTRIQVGSVGGAYAFII